MRVSLVSLHQWEEPVISGSTGSGTVFFSGCSLGCIYCQNHKISRSDVGELFSVERLAEKMLTLQAEHAMNVNLVTPTHFAPSIRRAIKIAKDRGLSLPIVWNTSGYEDADQISLNAGLVDVYLTDFKYADADDAKSFSDAPDYVRVALDAIDAMLETTGPLRADSFEGDERLASGIVIRHMVIPGRVQASKEALRILYDRYEDRVLYSIMNQYTPVLATLARTGDAFASKELTAHPELARTVSDEEYEEVLCFADELGMQDYFWQDGATCKESFIPDF